MEVYEGTGTVWVEPRGSEKGNRTSANSLVLELQESMERFQQKIFGVQGAMDQMSLEGTIQKEWLQEWVGHVKVPLGGCRMWILQVDIGHGGCR